jgi:hypothetical protein
MHISVKTKSSDPGKYYVVDFIKKNGLLRVACSCRAGELGQMCKHKAALLRGDASMLFDPGDDVDLLQAWQAVNETVIPTKLAELDRSLAKIEKEKKRLSADSKGLKKEFAQLLYGAPPV